MSVADEIAKLAALRAQGAITDVEFDQQKASLLGGAARTTAAATTKPTPAPNEWSAVPLLSKMWFQGLLCALVTPIGLIAMAANKSYRLKKGQVERVSLPAKAGVMALIGVLWLALVGMTLADMSGGGDEIVACDSDEARELLSNALEQNAMSNVVTLRLLDLRAVEEISLSADKTVRRCNGTLVTNAGAEAHGYTLSQTSTGDLLVEISPGLFPAAQPASAVAANALPQPDGQKTPAAEQAVKLDYGRLGPPSDEDFDHSIDPNFKTRAPADTIALFRRNEDNPPQGTEDRPMTWDAILEHAEYQRALFYRAAEDAPELISAEDWKMARAEEVTIVTQTCNGYPDEASRPYALTDTECEQQR